MFLTVSVEWHCPEPSTTTLAKGSGKPVKLDRGRYKKRVLCSSGVRLRSCQRVKRYWHVKTQLNLFLFLLTLRFLFAKLQKPTDKAQPDRKTVRRARRQKGRQLSADTSCRFNLFWHYCVLWGFPLWIHV